MSEAKQSTGLYWIVFLLSILVMFGFLWFKPAFFWVLLPLVLTSLVKATGRI